jgi:hypothetical protein
MIGGCDMCGGGRSKKHHKRKTKRHHKRKTKRHHKRKTKRHHKRKTKRAGLYAPLKKSRKSSRSSRSLSKVKRNLFSDFNETTMTKKQLNDSKFKKLLKKRREIEIQIEANKRNRKKKSMRRKSTRRKSSSDDMKFFVNELVSAKFGSR